MRILDTDTCVSLIRGVEPVLLRRATAEDQVATTWITAAELFYVLELDETSAQLFGEVKATFERQGRRLDDADLFIGSIAIARDAIVVTNNLRHYERIPGIRIESWMQG